MSFSGCRNAFVLSALLIGSAAAGRLQAQEVDPSSPSLPLDSILGIPIETAAKYKHTAREAPASVSIITSEEMRHFGYRTLGEAVMHLPGFYTTYDRNYLYVGVRGFGRPTDYNNRILLLIDGHPLNDNIYDAAALGTDFGLNWEVIERVEVVRGPGSALYGSSALFAVINVITKTGMAQTGRVTAELGSFGTRDAAAVWGREVSDHTDVLFSGHWGESAGQSLYFEEFDTPITNNGVAEDLDWDRFYGMFGSIRYRSVTVSAYLHTRRKGIPTAPWETVFNDQNAQTADTRRYIEARAAHDLSAKLRGLLRTYYDSYSFDGVYPYDDADGGDWTDENQGRWVGSELQLQWDPVPTNRVVLGAEYRRHLMATYHAFDSYDTYVDTDRPSSVASVFGQSEISFLANLSAVVGLRLDHYQTVGEAFTPRAALVYHATRSGTVKLLYGSAFRAPHVFESQYEEADEFKTNPDLKPERIRTVELVLEQRLGPGLHARAAVYDNRMHNLIEESEDPTDGLGMYDNIGAVRARGVELELSARTRAGVVAYLRYAAQSTRDAESDARLTNSPNHLVRAGAILPLPSGFGLAVNAWYDSARETVAGTSTEAHAVANLNLRTPEFLDRFRLALTVRNVLDTSYRLPGGWEHLQPSIQQDGRSLHLRLEVSQ